MRLETVDVVVGDKVTSAYIQPPFASTVVPVM
jgi:hypothetical protein